MGAGRSGVFFAFDVVKGDRRKINSRMQAFESERRYCTESAKVR